MIMSDCMQHPYLHPIEELDYLVDHQLLVMVQPFIHSGSLKDMIYKVTHNFKGAFLYLLRCMCIVEQLTVFWFKFLC